MLVASRRKAASSRRRARARFSSSGTPAGLHKAAGFVTDSSWLTVGPCPLDEEAVARLVASAPRSNGAELRSEIAVPPRLGQRRVLVGLDSSVSRAALR